MIKNAVTVLKNGLPKFDWALNKQKQLIGKYEQLGIIIETQGKIFTLDLYWLNQEGNEPERLYADQGYFGMATLKAAIYITKKQIISACRQYLKASKHHSFAMPRTSTCEPTELTLSFGYLYADPEVKISLVNTSEVREWDLTLRLYRSKNSIRKLSVVKEEQLEEGIFLITRDYCRNLLKAII